MALVDAPCCRRQGAGLTVNFPDLTSAEQLAAALGCEPETVQARALAGVLPGLKFGRAWVFPRDALLQALNQQAREQADARRAALRPAPAAVGLAPAANRRAKSPLPELPVLARVNGEEGPKFQPPAEPDACPAKPGGP